MPCRVILTSVSDEYCPHCDNHFVIDALTPKPSLQVEGEDVRKDSRYTTPSLYLHALLTRCARMLKDDRIRAEDERTIFDVKDAPNRLG